MTREKINRGLVFGSVLLLVIVANIIFLASVIDKICVDLVKSRHEKAIGELFSGPNGENEEIRKMLVGAADYPDVYTHLKTIYWEDEGQLIAQTRYLTEDGYGGARLSYASFRMAPDGRILEVLDVQEGVAVD